MNLLTRALFATLQQKVRLMQSLFKRSLQPARMRWLALSCIGMGLIATFSGCGGGNSADTTPKINIASVKVFGDSLSDSGTFLGTKYTVQGATTATPYAIWPERIATSYSVSALCARYMGTSASTAILNPAASASNCTNYAVGGGRINNTSGPTTPLAIGQQLSDAATAFGTYKATDLLLIDGGGNDAADLAGAFISSPSTAYPLLLSTLGVTPTAATQAALAVAGNAYMTKLADSFYTVIKTQALDKGATHVAVVNAPGITNTPSFKALLTLVAAQSGGGTTGAAAAAGIDDMIKSWVVSYNTQLAAKFAGDSRVTVVDFYTEFNNQITNPAQFALTNVTSTACPQTGTGTDGLPTYDFASCTSTALNTSTPNWQSYAFSDGFHPTPYGHQLLAQLVSRSLIAAGWL